MLLHAIHTSQNEMQQVPIRSSDTEVEMLACYLQENIHTRMVIASGTQSHSRVVSVPAVCQHLGLNICFTFLGFVQIWVF